MKKRQAQEIVRRAKKIGYKNSFVTSGFNEVEGVCYSASLCMSKDGCYRKYFTYYEDTIEWLESMEELQDELNGLESGVDWV